MGVVVLPVVVQEVHAKLQPEVVGAPGAVDKARVQVLPEVVEGVDVNEKDCFVRFG